MLDVVISLSYHQAVVMQIVIKVKKWPIVPIQGEDWPRFRGNEAPHIRFWRGEVCSRDNTEPRR